MWKPVPDPREAWDYLMAGILYYGTPSKYPDSMVHYEQQYIDNWKGLGYEQWASDIAGSPRNGYQPNYIYLEA